MARVRRLDLGDLRPATKRDDGTIRAQARLTRCGIFKYRQPDGTIRHELREPEEVFDKDSLDSFAGVPVTNDHPPEMVNAKNAKKYAVGSLQGVPGRDDDHVIGDLAVYDADTIDDMKSRRRLQVSLGYTCDLDETPGVHPVYGRYDARQLNIRGNHCAIVDVARAGQTACVRLDAAELVEDSGTGLAHCKTCATILNMADAKRTDDDDAPQGGSPKNGTPDPQDLASRNAAGDTDSAKKKRKKALAAAGAENEKADKAGARGEEPDDEDPDDPDDDDDEGDDDDLEDGDPEVSAKRKRKDDKMTDEEIKLLRKEHDAAIVRADAAEKALAKAEGELDSAKKDLEASKTEAEKVRTDAADKFDAAVDAKVELLTEARATGATVESKMTPIEIKRAVVKHVDKMDIAADKPEPYVDAYYEGALRRAKTDAADTKAGADALATARAVAAGEQPVTKTDAADLDEEAAARQARARTAEAWTQPWAAKNSKESK